MKTLTAENNFGRTKQTIALADIMFNEEKSVNAFAYFTEVFKRGIAKGFNELYKKKGDNDNLIKVISIEGSKDGQGLHSL
jgi:hypothetical protein